MRVSDVSVSCKRYFLNERGVRPMSYKAIESAVERLIEFTQTDDLKQINTGLIREFLYWGREELLWSPKTFRNIRQCLVSYFNFCIKFGYLSKNPVEEIDKPKLPQALPRSLTQEQAKIILAYTLDHPWRYELERSRNYAIIMTFLHTGLRLSELMNMHREDVDLHQGLVTVRSGKGQKDRLVPISGLLSRTLRRYEDERRTKLPPSRWYFSSVRSQSRMTQKNLQAVCTKISRASGIKVTPHMLRHTFARTAVENDMNLFKLMQVMGHADLGTTQRYLVFHLPI